MAGQTMYRVRFCGKRWIAQRILRIHLGYITPEQLGVFDTAEEARGACEAHAAA